LPVGEKGMNVCQSVFLPGGVSGKLRNFVKDDLLAITQLERCASMSPWSRQNFADSISSGHICVGIQVAEAWIAQAVFLIVTDTADLLIISVHPDWQGQGVGRTLLNAMIENLGSRAKELFLEVRASNARAIQLYESCGFNCVGTRPGYYPAIPGKAAASGREDALIYGLYLDSLGTN